MLNGENFRMSSEDVGKICDDFKLDEKYFRQTAPELMEIPEHRLEELDWKAFLLIEYFTEFAKHARYGIVVNADCPLASKLEHEHKFSFSLSSIIYSSF